MPFYHSIIYHYRPVTQIGYLSRISCHFSLSITPSERRLNQLKSARANAVQAYKKRKSEASSVLNVNLEIEDVEPNTTDTSDTEGESRTWFGNESPHESDSDTEGEGEDKEEDDENEPDLEIEESRTEEEVSPEVPKKEIKWHKGGEDRLRGGYGNGS